MAWSIFREGGGDAVAVGWAQQFLSALGAPVTPGNVEFIYQWEKAEGGGGKYNPLNTGPVKQHPEWTTTGEQYGGGAADYASWATGILGPKYFLEHYQQATYSKILSALKANNPAGARVALWQSPWAASHYGNGSHWPNVHVPGVAAVLPPTNGGIGGPNGPTQVNTAGVVNVADDTCAWKIAGGIVGGYCVASKKQVRNTLGVLLIGSSVFVGLVGVVLLVVYGLSDQVVKFIPGGNAVKDLIGKVG